ncbi:hypothetical protein [Providencia manganoxydans]|uniref:hypothetical protein n=1 Tax=Providencia manganoxydans TaxID=2923283 RepID=UPI0029C0D19B|nr:hypothetical protein [Providencia manganoxydans]MDX4948075.1 hypothetical protein [Providencia manganoxydans]
MKSVRMQFELPEPRAQELEALMDRCGISTKKELFNYALSILEWAVNEYEKGNDIATLNKDTETYQTLMMPIFKRKTS